MKKLLLASAVAVASFSTPSFADIEGLSGNIGYTSDYVFRGIDQAGDASGSAGIDYENSGFYIGTWAADVDDGLEYDIYFGYGVELENGLSLSAGATGYYYTESSFDSSYEEINLNAGFGPVSIEYSIGDQPDVDDSDYDFVAVTLEHKGAYLKYGSFGQDSDGSYVEVGYAREVTDGLEASASIITPDDDLVDENDSVLAIGLTYGFDL